MSQSWLELEDKVVIVTGGASGIGKHVVDTLVKVGAQAVIVDMNVETGAELDGAYCVQCNVTDSASVQAMADAVVEKFGRIDALVNNAGINLPRLLVDVKGEKPQYELNDESFGKMFAVNVKGVFLCAQACARQMLKQGKGVIVNMSSESGKEGSQGQSAYSATKGAVDSFTTVDSGKIVIKGVDLDKYTLVETAAPAGYNKLNDPVDVTVLDTNALTVEVPNATGTELPSTGGMGTTIFYIVGAVLVIGAGVVLVAKKRMAGR